MTVLRIISGFVAFLVIIVPGIQVHSGVIDKTVAKRLGHSKVSMTKYVYAHTLDLEDRRAVGQIENYIDKSIKKDEGSH